MAGDSDLLFKKWCIVKEQLISICALNKNEKNSEDIKKLLNEDIPLKNINSQVIVSICYFILGVMDIDERDKLIKWPLSNIQSHTKFRKGLSTIVLQFQEKYPWANIKKLPESYLVNPHGCQKKFVDFISRLTNLAIHLLLDDAELLIMHSGNGLSSREIEIMNENIFKARQYEEKKIMNNIFPIEKFEKIKNEVTDKCISLQQENDELEESISNTLKYAHNEGLIPSAKLEIEGLKNIKNEKIKELSTMNLNLAKYCNSSKEFLVKLKALKNPTSLSLKDFNCDKSQPNLVEETLRVCEDLQLFYQNIVAGKMTDEEEEHYYNELNKSKQALKEENYVLKSFLSKE